jgi:hypothetical protein
MRQIEFNVEFQVEFQLEFRGGSRPPIGAKERLILAVIPGLVLRTIPE